MEKTIAAISTGLAASGISIVRMSGSEAVSIGDRVFRSGRKQDFSLKDAPTHTIHYGFIHDWDRDLDEVLVSVMRAPRTYTGEDIVEINCHGGILVAKAVLELLLRSGAEAAEPGEFTKRAFLNGRIDLSEAEAVIDVIEAKNDFALRAGVAQLKGRVAETVRAMREQILDRVSYIEAALDDPEHYDLTDFGDELVPDIEKLRKDLSDLIRRADFGSLLKEGVRTVIAGRPNAGKSSLFNLLAGQEKAIVTAVAGTTRDVLETTVTLGSISLILNDTAGIRETGDPVERIGVDRARTALSEADLVLYLVDAKEGLTEEDKKEIEKTAGKPVILLLNKADLLDPETLEKQVNMLVSAFPDARMALPFSALSGDGLSALTDRIIDLYDCGDVIYNDQVVITSARHKALLSEAFDALGEVLQGADQQVSEEFLSVDLMNAYIALGKILGEEVGDDVIDRVFEKFCMGK